MKSTREHVYKAIDGERAYQKRACEKNNWTESKSIGEFLLTVEELVAKARTAWYSEPDAQAIETINNFRKIAATAVACLEEHGVLERISAIALKDEHVTAEQESTGHMQVVIKQEAGKDDVAEAHLIVGDRVDKIV